MEGDVSIGEEVTVSIVDGADGLAMTTGEMAGLFLSSVTRMMVRAGDAVYFEDIGHDRGS